MALCDLAFDTPLARRRRKEQEAREQEEREALEAKHQREIEREALDLKAELAALRFELLWAEVRRKAGFNHDQPRDEQGRWTDAGGDNGDLEQSDLAQSLATASDQPTRNDLPRLQELAGDPTIRSRINEAWNASNPQGQSRQEHGFWISRNEATGEIFTRPFANVGSARSITPGPAPSDAIAFFHTHPNPAALGYRAGPSRGDETFAADVGLPGLLQSHNGMYYFGPQLRPWRRR